VTDVQIGIEGIRPELHDEAVPIEDVTPYPGNARRGDIPKIRTSLLKHGQYKSLPVQRSTGYVLMGNNTYAAMRELGYTVVAVKYLDVDDDKAREMLLVDNASSDEAIYDDRALAALLAKVEDWDASGYAPDDLDDLLVALGEQGDPDKVAAALPPEVAAIAPTVLPTVPVTDARYGEDPEAERARQERFDNNTPRHAQGVTEVVLIYPEPVRDEVLGLIGKTRNRLGVARNGDIVHGALRLLAEVVEAERRGVASIDVSMALAVAVPPPGDDPSPDDPAAGPLTPEPETGAETDAREG